MRGLDEPLGGPMDISQSDGIFKKYFHTDFKFWNQTKKKPQKPQKENFTAPAVKNETKQLVQNLKEHYGNKNDKNGNGTGYIFLIFILILIIILPTLFLCNTKISKPI